MNGEVASTGGRAVYGHATATSGMCNGGRFESASTESRALVGYAYSTTGTTCGIFGLATSPAGTGVSGNNTATSGTTYGVYGSSASPSGYGVYFSGGLAGTGGKSCVVRTSKGPTLFYCQESPENWFEDFGDGRLSNGAAHIELDPIYVDAVTIDAANPMRVFIQLKDDCMGTFVRLRATGFDVLELQGGNSDAEFSYRVVAKRKGFEERRLDYCKAAETDPYLYPELREKELQELE